MPSNSIFTVRGYAILAPSVALPPLLGLSASSAFDYIFKLLLGRFGFPEFVVGVLQKLPVPNLENETGVAFGRLALRAWQEKRLLKSAESTSHAFLFPSLIQAHGSTLANRAAAWTARVQNSEKAVAAIQAEIDDLAFRLYGFDAADRAALTATLATEATRDPDAETGEDEEGEAATADGAALAADLLAYALGCVFGRWDIRYATGERIIPPTPDPFAPLPVCPPGILQTSAGLPAAPGDVPPDYPVRITWHGVVVDDPAHLDDVERRGREVLAVIFADRSDAVIDEACTLLGEKSLREWLRKPAGLFADHLRRYSKGGRQAPIYWILSSPTGLYTLWVYYHRLSPDTFFAIQREFVKPKLEDEERHLFNLKQAAGPSPTPSQAREIGTATALVEDLRAFRDEVQRVAPLWRPNLNDGVIINHAPLWRLTPHALWRKALKETWDALVEGDYDWAHLV